MRPRKTAESPSHIKAMEDRSQEERRRSLSATKGLPILDVDLLTRYIVDFMSEATPPEGHRYSSGGFQLKPSQRTLLTVISTCMRQFDPTFQYEDIDIELIPELFKFIGYHGQINKNIFMPVGAPHTWPNCIALMHWLVQLTRYHQSQKGENSNRPELWEEDQFIEELILAEFQDHPNDITVSQRNFDDVIMMRIRADQEEVSQLKQGYDANKQRLIDLNAKSPKLTILRQQSEEVESILRKQREELKETEVKQRHIEEEIERMIREEADYEEEMSRGERDIRQIEAKIVATGTNSQKVDAAHAEIALIQARMKQRKEEYREFLAAHEQDLQRLASAGNRVQKKVEEITAKHTEQSGQLEQRNLRLTIRPFSAIEIEAVLRNAKMTSLPTIQNFYLAELSEIKGFHEQWKNYNQSERATLEGNIVKLEDTLTVEAERLNQLKSIKAKLTEEVEILEKNLAEHEAQETKLHEMEQEQLHVNEDLQLNLKKIIEERLIEQQDLDRRSKQLIIAAVKIQEYKRNCDAAIEEMTAQARIYQQEWETLMKQQANSFAVLSKQMEDEYGDELNEKK